MKRMPRTLAALALGAAGYLLTEQVVVGVLVAAVSFWLLGPERSRRAPRDIEPLYRAPPPRRAAARPDLGGVEVVCKQVTPLRQEWVSVKTGRLYDVLSQNGPHHAQPGDRGRVIVESAGYRIEPLAEALSAKKPR
jgi:hypothetical protein